MKRYPLAVAVVLAALVLPATAEEDKDALPPAPNGKAWTLTWADEFDGPQLNTDKWTPEPLAPRKGGWWSPEAILLDGQGVRLLRRRPGDLAFQSRWCLPCARVPASQR